MTLSSSKVFKKTLQMTLRKQWTILQRVTSLRYSSNLCFSQEGVCNLNPWEDQKFTSIAAGSQSAEQPCGRDQRAEWGGTLNSAPILSTAAARALCCSPETSEREWIFSVHSRHWGGRSMAAVRASWLAAICLSAAGIITLAGKAHDNLSQ